MLQFRMKLKQILDNKGIQQKELAKMAGIREATISEIVNDVRISYNKEHLLKIMEALKIEDLNDILEVINVKR